MGNVVIFAVMSLDGYIAAPDDSVGELFDWYGSGEVEFAGGDPERRFRTSRLMLDNPHVAIEGDRVTHLRYRVSASWPGPADRSLWPGPAAGRGVPSGCGPTA